MGSMTALVIFLAIVPLEPREFVLDVPVYLVQEFEPEVLELAFREVEAIMAPGSIRPRFEIVPAGESVSNSNSMVSVLVLPRPARFLVHGCSRNRHDHRLGHTSFPARRITLWSEQVARAIDGRWDSSAPPRAEGDMYARSLGRVLAHELGHLLLRLYGHRDDGLMRSSFSHRTLVAKSRRAFMFSRSDLDKMRATLGRERP